MDEKVEAIKASDLRLLMEVVQAAVGLYNALETMAPEDLSYTPKEWDDLGEKLRALGLNEVET